jgi:hypothetical protein
LTTPKSSTFAFPPGATLMSSGLRSRYMPPFSAADGAKDGADHPLSPDSPNRPCATPLFCNLAESPPNAIDPGRNQAIHPEGVPRKQSWLAAAHHSCDYTISLANPIPELLSRKASMRKPATDLHRDNLYYPAKSNSVRIPINSEPLFIAFHRLSTWRSSFS